MAWQSVSPLRAVEGEQAAYSLCFALSSRSPDAPRGSEGYRLNMGRVTLFAVTHFTVNRTLVTDNVSQASTDITALPQRTIVSSHAAACLFIVSVPRVPHGLVAWG
jgi:hypothetical protein